MIMYQKPKANIIISSESFKASLKSGKSQEYLSLLLFFNMVLEIQYKSILQNEEKFQNTKSIYKNYTSMYL